ncbi:hypothetical protein [Ventosimonas gracilis]|nr:hypothetical protein [Ventosimonas gracilis]
MKRVWKNRHHHPTDGRSREDAESELDGLTQVKTCAAALKTYGCLGMC